MCCALLKLMLYIYYHLFIGLSCWSFDMSALKILTYILKICNYYYINNIFCIYLLNYYCIIIFILSIFNLLQVVALF
jgi:hypothetical protein